MNKASAILGLALLFAGIWWLREETMSRQHAVPTHSASVLIVEGESRLGEPRHGLESRVSAVLNACEIEADSTLVHVRRLDDAQFEALLKPALGPTNEAQFSGCVQDWTLDGVLVNIVSHERLAPSSGSR